MAAGARRLTRTYPTDSGGLELADELVSRIPNARRAELESDHYLPMREPEAFAQCVREFLS
jgi:hypothetical protein